MSMPAAQELAQAARRIRIRALKACHASGSSHIGSGLSCADLLSALYGSWLRLSPGRLDAPDRDRFILSKGHAAAGYYAALAEFGYIPDDWLWAYCKKNQPLGGHVDHHVPGVEVSTGSLGHGLPIGLGMALGAKREQRPFRVCVLLSDGELNAGSNWEAIMLAAAHNLDNLLVVVDANKLQALGRTNQVMALDRGQGTDLVAKWQAFGWAVQRINGHDLTAILTILDKFPFAQGRPGVIIADTIKGKGVSFMEDKLEWHYRSPKDQDLEQAMKELGDA